MFNKMLVSSPTNLLLLLFQAYFGSLLLAKYGILEINSYHKSHAMRVVNNVTAVLELIISDSPSEDLLFEAAEQFLILGGNIDRKDEKMVMMEYLSGYPKANKKDVTWMPQYLENHTEGWENLGRFSRWKAYVVEYFNSAIYITATARLGWRHARLVVLDIRPGYQYSGMMYGYTNGDDKIGIINENGTSWKFNATSHYEFIRWTNLTSPEVLNLGSEIISSWKSNGKKYHLIYNNCEVFAKQVGDALAMRTSEHLDNLDTASQISARRATFNKYNLRLLQSEIGLQNLWSIWYIILVAMAGVLNFFFLRDYRIHRFALMVGIQLSGFFLIEGMTGFGAMLTITIVFSIPLIISAYSGGDLEIVTAWFCTILFFLNLFIWYHLLPPHNWWIGVPIAQAPFIIFILLELWREPHNFYTWVFGIFGVYLLLALIHYLFPNYQPLLLFLRTPVVYN